MYLHVISTMGKFDSVVPREPVASTIVEYISCICGKNEQKSIAVRSHTNTLLKLSVPILKIIVDVQKIADVKSVTTSFGEKHISL